MVVAWERRSGDLRHAIQPRRVLCAERPPKHRGITRQARVSQLAEFGDFGVDGAEPGVGPLMFGVPLPMSIEFGTEVADDLFVAGDLALGLPNVAGEAVDGVERRCLFRATLAAELREGTEFIEALPGVVEAVVRPVQILRGRG